MKAYDLGGKRGRITQAELATEIGWHENTLRDIEKGRVDITPEAYQEAIDALNRVKARQSEREGVAA